jgi:hypothetical protein
MRRIIGITILVFASIVFLVSAVGEFTSFFFELRRNPAALNKWWGSDKGGAGDLYGFTSLPQFCVSDTSVIKAPDCTGAVKSYSIYARTDSYTEDIFKQPEYFCGAKTVGYAFANKHDVLPVYLDKTHRNIVMIECVERGVRTALADSDRLKGFITILKEPISETKAAEEAHGFRFSFNIKNLDGDYETNLWDYRFLRPLKQFKAKMTFDLFNRTYVDAYVSPDGKYLLYQPTVDTSYVESSYRPIDDKELNAIVASLNAAYSHYKALGFDDVYLSIIPNPTTVLYPNYRGLKYNRLIPKIQSHPALKLKVFDIYDVFTKSPDKDKLYQRSDTHWTRFASMVWLNEFNRKMASGK